VKQVYIIQKLSDCTFKIGVSKNPKQRLKAIQTGNEGKLKILTTYPSEYAHLIERTLHRQYDYCIGEGEWFDIPLTEALNFDSKCKQIEQNIIILKEKGNVFI